MKSLVGATVGLLSLVGIFGTSVDSFATGTETCSPVFIALGDIVTDLEQKDQNLSDIASLGYKVHKKGNEYHLIGKGTTIDMKVINGKASSINVDINKNCK